MAVEYINRKGDTYYLHEKKTKKGNPAYYFSRKKDGILVEAIPDGYEIYENPHAVVYLRRIRPEIITDEEKSIVENGVMEYSEVEHFIVDVKGKEITIFLPIQDLDDLVVKISRLAPPDYPGSKLREELSKILDYRPMMRFVLFDEESREFEVERWCFRGSIDDWIFLDSSNDLADLVKRYCRHLGRESFYDLSEFNPTGEPL